VRALWEPDQIHARQSKNTCLDSFARVADDINDFDEISASALKADAIKAANDYDELTRLDGQTLENAVAVGRADAAADVVRSTDNGATLLNSMDDVAVRSLLRIELPKTPPIDGVG
jgi:hypothetical protein